MDTEGAKIKQSVLVELLKTKMKDIVLEETLKEDDITIIDDITGEPVGKITFEDFGKFK